MSQEEEEIRRLVVEIRILEGYIQALQARSQIVEAAISDVTLAYRTLEGLRQQAAGVEMLMPIGAGSYIRASLIDVNKAIVGVGAGVAVEKSIDGSLSDFKNRLNDLERARASLQDQLTQLVMKLEDDRQKLADLLKERSGRTKTA